MSKDRIEVSRLKKVKRSSKAFQYTTTSQGEGIELRATCDEVEQRAIFERETKDPKQSNRWDWKIYVPTCQR